MKWIVGSLLVVGCLLIISSWTIQRDVHEQSFEWNHARELVGRFNHKLPESVLDRSKTLVIPLVIPNDHHWLLITRRLKPRFFILRKAPEGAFLGPKPDNPPEPLKVEITVNGMPAPLTVQTIHNEWGCIHPIHLGDRVELHLSVPLVAQLSDRTIQWGVDFTGEKEDHPDFGWSLSTAGADFLTWCGICFVTLGTLIFLLRQPPKAKAPVDGNTEV